VAARVAHNHEVTGSSPVPATKSIIIKRDWFQNWSLFNLHRKSHLLAKTKSAICYYEAMKKLFYVRHGETEMNAAGLLSGRIETPLTKKGIEQARQAGMELREKLPTVDLIICSPFERTYETAKLIAREIGYPTENIQKNDLFIERTFGVLEGTSAKDFLSVHAYRDFDDVDGSETIKQLQQRATMAFNYLKKQKEDNILVVGHGAFARALKRVVVGLPHTHEYEIDTSIGNATIVELL
jgi:broad specificity phosphatase PhoE